MADIGSREAASHLVVRRDVTIDDMREHFASTTTVPSSLGPMLDRLRDGMSPAGTSDTFAAQAREEMRRLRLMPVLACEAALSAWPSIRWPGVDVPTIRKFARRAHVGDGYAVVYVLRAHTPHALRWDKRALVAAYSAARLLDPSLATIVTDEDGELLAESIRDGKLARAERYAASLVADAHVALGDWLKRWNRRAHRPIDIDRIPEIADAAE